MATTCAKPSRPIVATAIVRCSSRKDSRLVLAHADLLAPAHVYLSPIASVTIWRAVLLAKRTPILRADARFLATVNGERDSPPQGLLTLSPIDCCYNECILTARFASLDAWRGVCAKRVLV